MAPSCAWTSLSDMPWTLFACSAACAITSSSVSALICALQSKPTSEQLSCFAISPPLRGAGTLTLRDRDQPLRVVLDDGGQRAFRQEPAVLVLGLVEQVERGDVAPRDLREGGLPIDPVALVMPDKPDLRESGRAELALELVRRREPCSIDR